MHFNEDDSRAISAIPAIPLWINGRASLRLGTVFLDVRNPVSGAVLRKVPVCGEGDVEEAILSAHAALPAWDGLGESRRRQLLSALGDMLEALAQHFTRLIAEETGASDDQAGRGVAEIVAHLRHPNAPSAAGAIVVARTSGSDVANLVSLVAAALAAGACVVVCPPLQAPSTLLALVELSGRCGFPAGVVSVVYPDNRVLAELHGRPGVTILSL